MKKVALVTGAARDGCAVVLADLNVEAGTQHAKRLEGSFVAADLSRREGCRKLTSS